MGKALNKVLSHSPYSTLYSGTSIKRSAQILWKFVRYIVHLAQFFFVRSFLFFAVNMHLSACLEGASFFVVFSFQVCLLVIFT